MKGVHTALITGATSGIGKAFAERLAGDGCNLIITGRRRAEIREVASRLKKRYHGEVAVIIAELADEKDLARVVKAAESDPDIEFLINNAGFGTGNPSVGGDIDKGLDMIRVHDLASVTLANAVLPRMIERGRGTIINVASLAAFIPGPASALYSATKSFLHVFSESLSMEVSDRGIRVQSLCPGFTRTDFHQKLGISGKQADRGLLRWMEPEAVVRASFKALACGKVLCIPGFPNRVIRRLIGLVPRWLYYRAAKAMYRRVMPVDAS